MKLILSSFLLFLVLTGCQNSSENSAAKNKHLELTSLGALFEDQAATSLIKAERFEDALGVYIDMLEKEPFKPQIHSNVGVIMSQIQKEEEALKSWEYALRLAEEQKDPVSLFAVNFNLGAYYGAKKNIPEALKHYQAALDVVPTSIETKTNIELLMQMQSQSGKGDSSQDQNQQQNQSSDQKDQKDQKNKDQQNKDQDKDQSGKDDQKKNDPKNDQDNPEKKRESSGKYKPRPFKGEQLNEGDVKKILGELRSQEQKIRANFDKKEQKESGNEKDW